jgi:hypothetical protein
LRVRSEFVALHSRGARTECLSALNRFSVRSPRTQFSANWAAVAWPPGYRSDFSTDGKTIYVTVGKHEADIWVMDLKKK